MIRILLASASLITFAVVDAAPPPVDSDDYAAMKPFAEWIGSQHDQLGRYCCDVSDGRPAEAQIGRPEHADVPVDPAPEDGDEHWWVRISPKHFPGDATNPLQPDHWAPVPDQKVIKNANPTGMPILWLYQGRIQCFAAPNGA